MAAIQAAIAKMTLMSAILVNFLDLSLIFSMHPALVPMGISELL